jgi:8-oxo-dGTP pyrophosphatase MutT (NUDIX family)
MTSHRENPPTLTVLPGGAIDRGDRSPPLSPADLERIADACDREALILSVHSGIHRECAQELRLRAADRRAARALVDVGTIEPEPVVKDWALHQGSLFDTGSDAVTPDLHEGALGQTSMFSSPLDLGQDDKELRSVDAARHAAQVTAAMDRVERDHGPTTEAERAAMRLAVDHRGRTAARLDLPRALVTALLKARGETST